MGAGEVEAGADQEQIGEDLPDAPTAPRTVTARRAAFFDGATRRFTFDENTGLLLDVHPVDQEVALAVLVQAGQLSSAPGMGSTLSLMAFLDGAELQAEAERRVRAALSRAIGAGDIANLVVETARRNRYRVRITVKYSNVRTRLPATIEV